MTVRPQPLPIGPGEESVWDYPRPPALDPDDRLVVVRSGGVTIAETWRSIRVLETSHPPTFYLPPEDVRTELLIPEEGRSVCEWKGVAEYFGLVTETGAIGSVAWSYSDPRPGYRPIAGHLAFYPGRVECWVGGERVEPQPGGFYGGWITPEVRGPFKGEPGTRGW